MTVLWDALKKTVWNCLLGNSVFCYLKYVSDILLTKIQFMLKKKNIPEYENAGFLLLQKCLCSTNAHTNYKYMSENVVHLLCVFYLFVFYLTVQWHNRWCYILMGFLLLWFPFLSHKNMPAGALYKLHSALKWAGVIQGAIPPHTQFSQDRLQIQHYAEQENVGIESE